MVIKSDNSMRYAVFVMILLEISAILWADMNDIFILCVFIVCDVYIILNGLVTWRTLMMDENGCTVQLFNYKRTYKWNELAIKRREYNYLNRHYMHKEGVFFSLHPVNKPKRMDPLLYCMFRHPFSCFFVYLAKTRTIENLTKGKVMRKPYKLILLADKEEFLEKMEEWGVELTE